MTPERVVRILAKLIDQQNFKGVDWLLGFLDDNPGVMPPGELAIAVRDVLPGMVKSANYRWFLKMFLPKDVFLNAQRYAASALADFLSEQGLDVGVDFRCVEVDGAIQAFVSPQAMAVLSQHAPQGCEFPGIALLTHPADSSVLLTPNDFQPEIAAMIPQYDKAGQILWKAMSGDHASLELICDALKDVPGSEVLLERCRLGDQSAILQVISMMCDPAIQD